MHEYFAAHHPFRIFAISGFITALVLIAVGASLGWAALAITLVLVAVEITFSFENAVVNARILATMSPFWQKMFLSVGIIIAIFGMRIIFPIAVVSLSAGLDWRHVIDLALHYPDQYASALSGAHHTIAAFGGMFLLMLGLHFFFDDEREIHWFTPLEERLKMLPSWLYIVLSGIVLAIISLLPANHDPRDTLVAGILGMATYLTVHGLSALFGHRQAKSSALVKTGMAGLVAFLYLEVLDASFSFDGVIGAFAITNEVILIAAGLGVGALWVRSLTVYMVRRRTLEAYRYLEHGAFYTVLALAVILLVGIFFEVSEFIAGSIGIILIGSAAIASARYNRAHKEEV